MRTKAIILILLSLSVISIHVQACMWDYDTLAMERQKFPETLELISGKFLCNAPSIVDSQIEELCC